MQINLKALIAKLNSTCRSSTEGAAGVCVGLTHYEVDIEHLLQKLLEAVGSDVERILKNYDVDLDRLASDLTRALDRLRSGNSRVPALSYRVIRLFSEAWTFGSVECGAQTIRSGHLLTALVANEDFARLARELSPEFAKIPADALRENFAAITAGSSEDTGEAPVSAAPEVISGAHPGSKTPALDQFTIDLTAQAKAGRIDPVLGRDFEIRQIIDILTRRRQNNPILTGEAGVGKTAVVEGFALRVAAGDVPPLLKDVHIRTLDLGLLQADAGVKGEFENRLKNVMAEVKQSPVPIILFIDEAHTLIGAGGQAGQNDAANLLKPALARGELRTIAATTWSEYKKYFEKDAALARRFQAVKIEEPDEQKAMAMMRGLVAALERHHKVRMLDEAVEAAVRLSLRFITGRQLPDKAVSVLDTACARVAAGQAATPAVIEDCRRTLQFIATEVAALGREHVATGHHADRLTALEASRVEAESRLTVLEVQLAQEQILVEKAILLRRQIEELLPESDALSLRQDLAAVSAELTLLQGEKPLIRPVVDAETVAQVISGWTGIPAGKMLKDEIHAVLNLRTTLEERVIGQSHALEAIAQRIRTARAGLEDPRRPKGVFLLVGPSGVGKTETALALADLLHGGERHIVTLNMSEFKEQHTVSTLKGSPPGYVGYGEGGVLTEAVRRKPYSVVLLDEFEKAHPEVREVFYQVFDKGYMEDGEGREVDFKNTIILATSNAASGQLMKLCLESEFMPEPDAIAEAINPELRRVFKPALLGRMVVVPYYPINEEVMRSIIELKLSQIRKRFEASHNLPFTWSADVVSEIGRRCSEVETGARNADHIITGTLLPEISGELLTRLAEGRPLGGVHIGFGADGFECEMADPVPSLAQM